MDGGDGFKNNCEIPNCASHSLSYRGVIEFKETAPVQFWRERQGSLYRTCKYKLFCVACLTHCSGPVATGLDGAGRGARPQEPLEWLRPGSAPCQPGTTVPRRPCESRRGAAAAVGTARVEAAAGGPPRRWSVQQAPGALEPGHSPEPLSQSRVLAGGIPLLCPLAGPGAGCRALARRPPAQRGDLVGRAEDGESDGTAKPPDALAAPRSHRGVAGG